VFRSLGLSFQEVSIALMGKRHEHARELGRFAVTLGIASSAGLALVALTPLSGFWFHGISGLSPELTAFAIRPTIILIPIPLLSVLLSYQRGILVVGHRTRPLTWATVIEVGGIALLFPLLGWKLGLVGVTAATSAFLVGRGAGNLFLITPCLRALGRSGRDVLVRLPESSPAAGDPAEAG
jgi:O-antigen/teichoic acid export membrane protein